MDFSRNFLHNVTIHFFEEQISTDSDLCSLFQRKQL